MKEALQVSIGGIKCDNPNCNYADQSVEFKDYPNWVNKPCPICGENLLTEQDFKTCNFIYNLAQKLNRILPKVSDEDETKKAKAIMHFDGSGKVDIDIDTNR